MADAFIGEIRMFGANFAPLGWEFCNGQLLAVSEYEGLFALIGTTYGGDGSSTFALPDLRGRVPVHAGAGAGLSVYQLGSAVGTESVTLVGANMAGHHHPIGAASGTANAQSPVGGIPAVARDERYWSGADLRPMHSNTVAPAGGGQPHNNMQPSMGINFIIAVQGIFPSQS